ncbi:hypothetical protein K469DRAFT_739020 [Zopfia rhizophila CBS 207.26]|uniref:NAD(P)-binding protein n=1 Tax=Zopfia rhizophila CBS 207.26 TaxID=1314779 RepID=A0A6A6E035_9PEZI|nr:hypothetical protein K469DRAFT_739020 [Zopfia rhizophila CBS 207.26]
MRRRDTSSIIKDINLGGHFTSIFRHHPKHPASALTRKVILITGAHIYATVRDLSKGLKSLTDILEPGKLDLLHLDLNSPSVRKCTSEFLALSSTPKLNIVISSAGVTATPEGRFNSRVVNVSRTGHRYSQIHFDHLNLEGEYEPNIAYGQSKLANIYIANDIDRCYGSPGIWVGSGLQKHIPEIVEQWKATSGVAEVLKSPAQGATTTGKGGKYLEECQVSPPCKGGSSFRILGYEKYVYDQEESGAPMEGFQ